MEQLYSYGQCEGSDESCVCVCWGYLRHRLIRLSHLLNAFYWVNFIRKIQNNNDYKIKEEMWVLKKTSAFRSFVDIFEKFLFVKFGIIFSRTGYECLASFTYRINADCRQ